MKLTNALAKVTLGVALIAGLSGCRMIGDSGVWSGSAVSRDGFRESYSCNVEVDITHTEEYVTLHHVATDCGTYAGRWHAGTFEIHGGTVWRNGKAVGWARDDGSVTLDITDPSKFLDNRYPYPASRLMISWMRVGESLEYTEEAHFPGRVQKTNGWLRRR